jgi:hypothetical protein
VVVAAGARNEDDGREDSEPPDVSDQARLFSEPDAYHGADDGVSRSTTSGQLPPPPGGRRSPLRRQLSVRWRRVVLHGVTSVAPTLARRLICHHITGQRHERSCQRIRESERRTCAAGNRASIMILVTASQATYEKARRFSLGRPGIGDFGPLVSRQADGEPLENAHGDSLQYVGLWGFLCLGATRMPPVRLAPATAERLPPGGWAGSRELPTAHRHVRARTAA